jgi:hypothetical protein
MPTEPTPDDARYADARDAFSRLGAGEQAAFALEALLTAGGAFVQEAGRQVSRAVRDVERAFDDASGPEHAPDPEPEATPETPSP